MTIGPQYPTPEQLQLIEKASQNISNISHDLAAGSISQESADYTALTGTLNALLNTPLPSNVARDFQNLISTTPANLNQNLSTVSNDLNQLWTTPPTTTTWIADFQQVFLLLSHTDSQTLAQAQQLLNQVIVQENDPHSLPTKQAEAALGTLNTLQMSGSSEIDYFNVGLQLNESTIPFIPPASPLPSKNQ